MRKIVSASVLSGVIMVSLLAVVGTLYVSVPIVNADDVLEEETSLTTQPISEVVFIDPEYGYAVGEDGTMFEFDDDGSDWINEASPPTQSFDDGEFLDLE